VVICLAGRVGALLGTLWRRLCPFLLLALIYIGQAYGAPMHYHGLPQVARWSPSDEEIRRFLEVSS